MYILHDLEYGKGYRVSNTIFFSGQRRFIYFEVIGIWWNWLLRTSGASGLEVTS